MSNVRVLHFSFYSISIELARRVVLLVTDVISNNISLTIGKTPREAAAKLAQEMISYFLELLKKQDYVSLAISGGETPKTLYELLVKENRFFNQMPWKHLQLFWVDERWVPHDHPASNFRMVQEILLSRVPIPKNQIHPMPVVKLAPNIARLEYEKALRETFNLSTSQRDPPKLDLVLLGMGEDGHTASIFPGKVAENLIHATSWVECPFVPQLNVRRMTLTPVMLNAAKEAWFLVTGKKKSAMLRKVLQGDYNPVELPAQLVKPSGKTPKWYIDADAASELYL